MFAVLLVLVGFAAFGIVGSLLAIARDGRGDGPPIAASDLWQQAHGRTDQTR